MTIKQRPAKKITALLLCLALCLALALSAFYIFTHAHHHCDGADCPVCVRIAACAGSFALTGAAVFLCAPSVSSAGHFGARAVCMRRGACVFSLIALKVKLLC